MLSLTQLNEKFALGDQLSFTCHPSGLIVGNIQTAECVGTFFLHGAHVTHFQPTHTNQPVLFLSEAAYFSPEKPIRGGIPICFPWFSSHPFDASLPAHGWARISAWDVTSTQLLDATIEVVLTLRRSPYELSYTLRFSRDLEITFKASNISDQLENYEIALHTYLQIGSISRVAIHGDVNKLPFLDQLTGAELPPKLEPIRFQQETDRIYFGAAPQITLRDQAWNRIINIESQNSQSTIIWNPWVDKSKRMPDFGDLEYLQMCCIETANVRRQQVSLPSHQSHTTSLKISVANLENQ